MSEPVIPGVGEVPGLPAAPAVPLVAKPHQERVSNELDTSDGKLLYHGVGTGKTFSAINAAQQHNLPLIAIMPASLRNNFRKEIAAAKFKLPSEVYSYDEALTMMQDPEFLARAENSLVATDEVANLGHTESLRSKLLGLKAKKKLLLSATPARNAPHELAPLLNSLGGEQLPTGSREFAKKFLATRVFKPSVIEKLRGVKPGSERFATNLAEFRKALAGKIDYQAGGGDEFPTTKDTTITVPLTEAQRDVYRAMVGKDRSLAYKIQHNLPPSKDELARFQAFSTGPRQVVNDGRSFNTNGTQLDAPKIEYAADEVQKRLKANPDYRGISYSNFLGAGAKPLLEALKARGIEAGLFSGEIDDVKRKELVDSYNAGKIRQLVLTGAGSEGLDLKGTRLVQLLEPYWNETRPDQVVGRAARFRSHAHLPAADRNVEVQRYQTVDREEPGWWGKLWGDKPVDRQTIDGYLYGLAERKAKVLEPFLEEMRRAGTEGRAKYPARVTTKAATDQEAILSWQLSQAQKSIIGDSSMNLFEKARAMSALQATAARPPSAEGYTIGDVVKGGIAAGLGVGAASMISHFMGLSEGTATALKTVGGGLGAAFSFGKKADDMERSEEDLRHGFRIGFLKAAAHDGYFAKTAGAFVTTLPLGPSLLTEPLNLAESAGSTAAQTGGALLGTLTGSNEADRDAAKMDLQTRQLQRQADMLDRLRKHTALVQLLGRRGQAAPAAA